MTRPHEWRTQVRGIMVVVPVLMWCGLSFGGEKVRLTLTGYAITLKGDRSAEAQKISERCVHETRTVVEIAREMDKDCRVETGFVRSIDFEMWEKTRNTLTLDGKTERILKLNLRMRPQADGYYSLEYELDELVKDPAHHSSLAEGFPTTETGIAALRARNIAWFNKMADEKGMPAEERRQNLETFEEGLKLREMVARDPTVLGRTQSSGKRLLKAGLRLVLYCVGPFRVRYPQAGPDTALRVTEAMIEKTSE